MRLSNCAAVASLAACLACAHAPSPSWADAPLAPPLRFAEPVHPGSVLVLVLDAHSGAPLGPSAVGPGRAWVGVQGGARGAFTDSIGRAVLEKLAPGKYLLMTRALGYARRTDSLTVPADAGVALVVQLRRVAPDLVADPVEWPSRRP